MLRLFLLTVVAIGCSAQGMLGFPEGCDRASCTAYVQWTLISSDTVQFELEGMTMGWVAVGVSADRVMGVDGIDDVFACQRDTMNDTVYAQDTYNVEVGRNNIPDTNQNGFQLISSSFASGRISCTFTRSILADNLAEDRNLNEKAFLLLAINDMRGGPVIDIQGHMPAQQQASMAQVVIAPAGTFGFPEGCDRARCMAYVQWTLMGSDTLEFELEGTTMGWVAVGVSADRVMGTDGIDDVFACQRDTMNDTVYAQDTYNVEVGRNNMRDTDQTGFTLISSSFTSGRISCTFTRSILADNLAEDRNLDESAFLLLAYSDARGGPDVVIPGHDPASRVASTATFDLASGQIGIAANLLLSILMSLAGYWVVATVM